MKFQQLPSSFCQNGASSLRQHLACFIINDAVSIDAGSLAMAASDFQKENIRDIVLTHAHLDHIAGLPLFIDDLFATLTEPIRIYAIEKVIEALENHVFNWEIYPRFSELRNENGAIIEYKKFKVGEEITIKNLKIKSVEVNHKVPSVGFIISDENSTIALSSDTSKMKDFWEKVNAIENLQAILIECAFPDELSELACASHHLTPKILKSEIEKCTQKNCPIYVINLKPMYREKIISELKNLEIGRLQILEVGKIYEF